jgi:hypothetical protein
MILISTPPPELSNIPVVLAALHVAHSVHHASIETRPLFMLGRGSCCVTQFTDPRAL